MTIVLAVFFAFGLAVFLLGLQGTAWFPLTVVYEVWKRRALRRIAPFRGMASVIVPAFNEERTIRETLLTLLESDWKELEIIVVDDGSTDGTAERVSDLVEQGKITYLKQANAGKAAALNAGMALAKGDVILYTDADSLFFPQTVRLMVRWFGDPRIDAVCGNDAPLHPGTALQKLLVITTHLGTGFVRRSLSLIGCLPIISGNLGAIRRSVLAEIGNFAEVWGEDLEITFRLHRHHKRIIFDPEPRVLAECPATFTALWKQRVRWVRSYLKVSAGYGDLFFRPSRWPFSLYLPINFTNMGIVPVLQAALLLLLPAVLSDRRFHLGGALALLSTLGVTFFFVAAVYSILLDRDWRDLRYLLYGLLILPVSFFFNAVVIYSWWSELRGAEERWHKFPRRDAAMRAALGTRGWQVAVAALLVAVASSAATWVFLERARLRGQENLLAMITAAPERPLFRLGLSTHFNAWPEWRDALKTVRARPLIGRAQLIGVGAGRTEWTYFRWKGHEQQWSNHQRGEPVDDLLLEATRTFQNRGLKVAALVDLFAPKYIHDHPGTGAVRYDGDQSESQVALAELADGDFGALALEMIEYIAANYPVDAIDLTEAPYYEVSFGPKDLKSYAKYSGHAAWPRNAQGEIDIEDPSIWEWKSATLERFVAKAGRAARRHGKLLYMDVSASWKDFARNGREFGHDYRRLLQHADAIVVWNYFALEGQPASASADLARYLVANFPQSHFFVSLGLWGEEGPLGPRVLGPDELEEALAATLRGGATQIWVTPNDLLTDAHWTGILRHFTGAMSRAKQPAPP